MENYIVTAIYRHPVVMEVAVVAVPDEKWGEVPKAFVTPKPGAKPTAEEIIEYGKANLARFKAPKAVGFFDTCPYSNQQSAFEIPHNRPVAIPPVSPDIIYSIFVLHFRDILFTLSDLSC